jgi:hypothetical protein
MPSYSIISSDTFPSQILPRNHIAAIFSNFSDVINLAEVMLATLEEAVPDRPSDPLPFSLVALRSSTSTPELSSSVETEDESDIDGPQTPDNRDAGKNKQRNDRDRFERNIPPPVKLGNLIKPIIPFFKAYSFFISNFSTALSRLSSLESPSMSSSTPEDRQRWKVFCDERRSMGLGRGLGLGGLLLNIIQRIPRYRLLLADLVKYTSEGEWLRWNRSKLNLIHHQI